MNVPDDSFLQTRIAPALLLALAAACAGPDFMSRSAGDTGNDAADAYTPDVDNRPIIVHNPGPMVAEGGRMLDAESMDGAPGVDVVSLTSLDAGSERDVSATSPDAPSGGDADASVCAAGATQCSNFQLQTCSQGQWVSPSACAVGQICIGGGCAVQLLLAGGRITASQGLPVAGVIANVTDAITMETASALSASIDWGDGSPSTFGGVAGGAGSFQVTANHSYAAIGTFTAAVTLTDALTSGTASIKLPVTVRPLSIVEEFAVPTANVELLGIAAGPDGNVWFTESTADKISRITVNGAITEFPIPTTTAGPYGIASGPGGLWFAEGTASRIGWITTSGFVTEFAIPSGARPIYLATGPDGNVWFTERKPNNGIGRVTPQGVFAEFPIPTVASFSTGIAAGMDGNIWFTESYYSRIGRVTLPSGSITEFVTQSLSGGIAAGPDGNMWVMEAGANPISRVTPGGMITEFSVPTPGAGPGIAAGPDGNLWFAAGGNQIGRITPTGMVTEFTIPTANSGPWALVAGPDGKIWFTESRANKIGRITP